MRLSRYLLIFPLVIAGTAHAATYNVSSSQSTARIQSVISAASPGDTVAFAAGTYRISAAITLKCGVVYTGPIVPLNANGTATPTAVLSSTMEANVHIFNLYSVNAPANPCRQPTVINCLGFSNGSGIFVETPFTNLLIRYNQFLKIPGAQDQTDALFFRSSNSNSNTAAQLTNTTVTYNRIGDTDSCMGPYNVMASHRSPEQYEGACNGIVFQTSINGFTLTHNNFDHVAEGVHINCPNYGNQKYECEPPNGALTQNISVQYNDFNHIHRIAWEQQPQQSLGVIYQYNSEHDWVNPYFGTMGISMSCCYNGARAPYLNVSSNLVIFNVSPTLDVRIGYGIEAAGYHATYANNYVVAHNYGVPDERYPPAPGMAYSCGPVSVMANNTVLGGFHGEYIVTEGITGPGTCGTDTVPANMTGNITGPTVKPFASAAPTIAQPAGSYPSPLQITLSDTGFSSGSLPLSNTSIYYTTDGTNPVPGAGTTRRYSKPFSLELPATLKVVGMWGAPNQPTSYAAGYGPVPSAVVSATYQRAGPRAH